MFKNNNTKAILCVLLANFCFGVNFSLVKIVTGAVAGYDTILGPYALNVFRVGISTLLFWILYIFNKNKEKIKKEHLWRFALCAICGVILNQTLFIGGLVLTSTIHAAILILGTPVFITLIAWLFLKERVTITKIAGFVLALSAAIFLALQKENANVGSNIFLGDVLVLLNAIAYAIYFVLVKPLMAVYRPLTVIRMVFTMALPIMVIIGFTQLQQINFSQWQPASILALAGIVLGATFLSYLCNAIALQTIGAARTGSFIYTQPVIATIIAIVFLNDFLSWQKVVAALFIICGVVLINKKTASHK
jgi:drug/metabolite transporter (DMT)-like permease